MILLYGPPGTGKTSLCKALAQKIYIRHCHTSTTVSAVSLAEMFMSSVDSDNSDSLPMHTMDAYLAHQPLPSHVPADGHSKQVKKSKSSVRYRSGLMFEVNCHSLFSKWFSESGKLVMKLFNHISEIAEDETCLTILLIDEVESIASARSNASSSGEPGDAIRVVNAVLTSLDSLKRKPNVLVMCTSNMISSLDEVSLSLIK
jgi:SpoVK/Ycf46/Vps4 family AAA+-type ATPase